MPFDASPYTRYVISDPTTGAPRATGESETTKMKQIGNFIDDASPVLTSAQTHVALVPGSGGTVHGINLTAGKTVAYTDDAGLQTSQARPPTDGSVTTAKLATTPTPAVSTATIQDGAVTTPKLASLAVLTGNIGNGQVTSPKMGSLAISNAALQDDSVDSRVLQDSAVQNVNILDGAVDILKLDIPTSTPGYGDPDYYIDASLSLQLFPSVESVETCSTAATYVRREGSNIVARFANGDVISSLTSNAANNTEVIADGIESAGTGGVCYLYPSMTAYDIASPVQMSGNASFNGSTGTNLNGGTILHPTDDFPAVQFGAIGSDPAHVYTNPHGASCSHLVIDMSSGPTSCGIEVNDTGLTRIDNVTVYGGDCGLQWVGHAEPDTATIHTNRATNCNVVSANTGYRIYGGAAGTSDTIGPYASMHNGVMTNCTTSNCLFGLVLQADSWRVTDNRFAVTEGVNGVCAAVKGGSHTIHGNHFVDGKTGLDIGDYPHNVGGSTVTANTFEVGKDFNGSDHAYVDLHGGGVNFSSNVLHHSPTSTGTARANLKAFVKITSAPVVGQSGLNTGFTGLIVDNLIHLYGTTSAWIGPVCFYTGASMGPWTPTEYNAGAYLTATNLAVINRNLSFRT